MLKALALSVAALAAGVAALGATPAPKPTATPFALGTLQPFGSGPPPPVLPDIGRTRAVAPACAVIRDLVVPSFAAAQRADKRFVQTRKNLPKYAEVSGDPEFQNDSVRQMVLSKLDSDASALLEQTQIMSKALGDPRLAAGSTDPQVAIERRQLQQLYQAQQTRANLLNEFVIRERAATARHGIENSAFSPSTLQPLPQWTNAPGMPLRSTNALVDKNSLDDWGAALSTYVRKSEDEAARTIHAISESCR